MKVNKSWSKPEGIPNLIGIKKVDWSIFEDGSTIPSNFHEDFDFVNEVHLNRGDRYKIHIIHEDKTYEAQLVNVPRKDIKSGTYQIRYDSNEELKKLLKSSFKHSYKYLKTERLKGLSEGNKKNFVIVPDDFAEYIQFFSVGQPFKYEIKLIPRILQEEIEDSTYQKEIAEIPALNSRVTIKDAPVAKPIKTETSSSTNYKRNAQIGRNAIIDASYQCEVNSNHKSFTSRVTGENYVEAHHLIPMEYQDSYDVSIDVEANIVSLCVACHKTLHHAIFQESEAILNTLFNKRYLRLEKCGIKIKKEILTSYYK